MLDLVSGWHFHVVIEPDPFMVKCAYPYNLMPKILPSTLIFLLSVSGLQTSQDARFYASSARFEPFSNEGKPLVIQFTVKHEQKIDCGGGYVKVFPADLDQTDMHGESSYYLMFGTC